MGTWLSAGFIVADLRLFDDGSCLIDSQVQSTTSEVRFDALRDEMFRHPPGTCSINVGLIDVFDQAEHQHDTKESTSGTV